MYPGSCAGKTFLMNEMIRQAFPAGPYKVLFISKKGFDLAPGPKVIPGEIIREYPAIEAAPDAG